MASSALPQTPTVLSKRSEPPLTPATSVDDAPTTGHIARVIGGESEPPEMAEKESDEPPKKKRRVALTRVGDLDP